ncbi:MAG: hypothetical protein COV45_07275 [Deltaproteobacteria bacterium CG11_big_fil_rev_8_21_14_0_20_47_16]|nr:MAG: hypothetical protein COV45_07275 [Deltaproteobacteria bacterium CG11_big_fil_rev_8_21_14_0_20_47_16]
MNAQAGIRKIGSFAQGTQCILLGFRYLFSNPKLIAYAILPFIVQVAILVALLAMFGGKFSALFQWLSGWVQAWHIQNPDTIWLKTMNFFLWGATEFFRILVFIVGIILVSIAGFVIGMVITSPLNDLLSEKTEATQREPQTVPFTLHYLWYLIRGELAKAVFLLAVPLALLLFNLIPGFGTVIYVALSSIFGMWSMGIAYIDYPVSRANPTFGPRFAFYREHFAAISGFGVIFFIPFFNFIFSSPLVVGSTLLYMRLTPQSPQSRP